MHETNIADLYNSGAYQGWLGEEPAKEAWDLIKGSDSFKQFSLSLPPTAERKMFLWDVVRKVLGKDTINYPQEIGDCVSFGAKNATEYLQCCEILMKGDAEKFRRIFPPYYYGTGRVYVGKGQLGNGDGSLGAWMADAVVKYGTLASDVPGVPSYAGSVAKAWGAPSGRQHLDKWVEEGKKHLVKSAAKINSWDELVAAIVNGYPCTVASMQGFQMSPNSSGFHNASGQWAHQMCIVGVDDTHSEPHAFILNSWGDVHGQLKDFYTGETLPVGMIRAKRSVVEGMIRNGGETFAFSNFDGFPEQDLPKELFKVI